MFGRVRVRRRRGETADTGWVHIGAVSFHGGAKHVTTSSMAEHVRRPTWERSLAISVLGRLLVVRPSCATT